MARARRRILVVVRRAGDFPIAARPPSDLCRTRTPTSSTTNCCSRAARARAASTRRRAGDDLAKLDALPGPRVYVKHRRGVKGQSVRPLARDAALHWLSEQSPAQRANFVVQAEVPPALLPDGRRFVLRSHVLVIARARAPSAYVHRDVVVLPHAAPDSDGTQASHVSQAGRGHPPPTLLADLGAEHPAGLRGAGCLRSSTSCCAPPPPSCCRRRTRRATRARCCTRCSASTSWSIAAAASCCSRRIRTRRSPTARWPRCRGRCTTTSWAVCSASSCCHTSRIARPTPANGSALRTGGRDS